MSSTSERASTRQGRQSTGPFRRTELAVPAGDVSMLRRVAALLREGGRPAERLREQLSPEARGETARTGADLVAFFRASPLVSEEGLEFERDRSPGRPVEL